MNKKIVFNAAVHFFSPNTRKYLAQIAQSQIKSIQSILRQSSISHDFSLFCMKPEIFDGMSKAVFSN
ncbi:hypothetical protein BpHYR1_020180 [Brachionus plicatilis]|uniref:Uncharacterized protein n=1 Tax=Brachionus plicatilis TaxID=10195 RepID=A0A3M7QP90_BRAPC|nr:hypothetical protein BpHYR1_020180 [Brachionus plicatilis]